MYISILLVVDAMVSTLNPLALPPVIDIIDPSEKVSSAIPPATNEFAVTIPVTFAPALVAVSIPTLETLVSTLEATV